MNNSSFHEHLTDSSLNNTTTRNDDEVGISHKEPELYEYTGLVDTSKNIDLQREKQRHTGSTNKVRPLELAQEIGMEKLEGGKRRQKPSIGTCRLSPKARVGIMLQRTPKMMQNRPKHMIAQIPKARPVDRKSAETPTSKVSFPQTSLRTRSKIRSCKELENNQQEKAPKFRARPLNQKILESKGELGLFSVEKRRTTIPHEFRFATNERIQPLRTDNKAEFYDKIASCLQSPKKKQNLRNTITRPFHFRTDKRGAVKESKFALEIVHQKLEEERTRIPKSNPNSCTTNHPVVRLKPESRHYTKHPFRLDTLVRHEKEIQGDMEERNQLEDEEANMRILKEDPTPVPERIRIPLTPVQVYNLHLEQRAIDGTGFDKKLKKKDTTKMVDEEIASKPDTRHVPRFKQSFLPQKIRSFKGATNSMSPRYFLTRKGRQSKMAVTAAISSAASRMR